MGEYYGFHYNQPNISTVNGVSYGNDGDYWFTYGNTLFMVLNSNTESAATHRKSLALPSIPDVNRHYKI